MIKTFLRPKMQKRLQKHVILWSTVFTAVTIFFALGFSTEFGFLFQIAGLQPGSANYINGVRTYYRAMQDFNSLLFTLAFVMLIPCIAQYIFFNQKRRIYYISNYIVSIAMAAYMVFMSIFILFNIISLANYFNQIDSGELQAWIERSPILAIDGITSIPSNITAVLAVMLCVVLVVLAAGLIFNLFVKHCQHKQIKKEYLLFDKQKALQNTSNTAFVNTEAADVR